MRAISPSARRTAGRAATAVALFLAAAVCPAQVRGRIRPADAVAARYGTVTVSVDVDLRGSGKLLGSYGATLGWDPAKLGYVSDTGGGQSIFDVAVVNRADAPAGWLTFADASATGVGGLVNVFNVTFEVLADPFVTTMLDLDFTSLYAAATYEDLHPLLQVQDGVVWIADFDLDLKPAAANGTLWTWKPIPGAVAYDLIRGQQGMLFDSGTVVQLGDVVCVEDDSTDTTTAAGAEPAHPDPAVPAAGGVFFYLVRFHDGVTNATYGYSFKTGRPRVAGPGDCF